MPSIRLADLAQQLDAELMDCGHAADDREVVNRYVTRQRCVVGEDAAVTYRTIAVSYTHLDVYKRQVHWLQTDHVLLRPRPDKPPGCR